MINKYTVFLRPCLLQKRQQHVHDGELITVKENNLMFDAANYRYCLIFILCLQHENPGHTTKEDRRSNIPISY